jgi:hypothetical protein
MFAEETIPQPEEFHVAASITTEPFEVVRVNPGAGGTEV